MGKKLPAIDAYIAKSQDFAKPVLRRLRDLVHAACPDVEETLKWGAPHFMHKGMLCAMASFKSHCAFGFWKGKLILGKSPRKPRQRRDSSAELPGLPAYPGDKLLSQYIKEAVRLNEEGVKTPARTKPAARKKLSTPAYFMSSLRKNMKALRTYQNFSPSHKREYIEWVTEARTEATRQKRLKAALEWMSEGKVRNWKYVKKS